MKSLLFILLFVIGIVAEIKDSTRYNFTFYPDKINLPILTFKNVSVTKADSDVIMFVCDQGSCKWQIGKSLFKNNKDFGNYLLLQYDEVKEDTLFKEQK